MMFPTVHGIAAPHASLFQIIQGAGLTTGLEIVLDAGDILSYSSGQRWFDSAGGGTGFFLGAIGGDPATDDPTFNGDPGAMTENEHFSFDGGDIFRYDRANELWMNNIHKNNALFTLMEIVYVVGSATSHGFSGTDGAFSTNIGFDWHIDGGEKQKFRITDGSGFPLSIQADTGMSVDTWHMLAVSIDEAAGFGGGFLYKDGAFDQVVGEDTFDATYSGPSAAAATFTMEIGALGNAAFPLLNTERMACFAAWEGTVLTKEKLDSIWDRIRGRFNI